MVVVMSCANTKNETNSRITFSWQLISPCCSWIYYQRQIEGFSKETPGNPSELSNRVGGSLGQKVPNTASRTLSRALTCTRFAQQIVLAHTCPDGRCQGVSQ